MNFTRDPLIQTVITPKEGFKLVVRNSKVGGQEEFIVDAIEVITIGNNCFFRSSEKPKSFLVPASDYEIFEARETRVMLKAATVEKGNIKIGGGREAAPKVARESKEEEKAIEPEALLADGKTDKRRDRRRLRKRRDKTDEESEKQEGRFPEEQEAPKRTREERPSLIPPPPTLISETIGRYKTAEVVSEPILEEESVKEDTGSFEENSQDDQEIPF